MISKKGRKEEGQDDYMKEAKGKRKKTKLITLPTVVNFFENLGMAPSQSFLGEYICICVYYCVMELCI